MQHRVLLWMCVWLLSVSQSHSYPLHLFRKFSLGSQSDKNWLWGWAWGADSTVSIVDRSPPLSFPSRPAAFGAELADPLLGYVIPLSAFTAPCPANASTDPLSNRGCPKLCVVGPHQPEPTETWIALVQRGGCEFVSKVREAQRLGAKAVVIGGEDPARTGIPDTLVSMYSPGDASDVAIASTYIRHADYVQLLSLIAASNTSHSGLRTLSLLITTEYSAWEWYSPILTFIIILLLPSTLTFVTLLVHRVRASRAAQRDRAPEEIVHHLPWRVWTGTRWEKHEGDENPDSAPPTTPSPDLEQGLGAPDASDVPDEDPSTSHGKPSAPQPWFETQLECAICISEFVKGDKVRVLPCHHIFHMDEIDAWLIQRKKLCPICKADVTQPPRPPAQHDSIPDPQAPEVQSPEPRPDGDYSSSPSTSPPADERTPLLRDAGP